MHLAIKFGTNKTGNHLIEVEFENAAAFMTAHTAREYAVFRSHCLRDDTYR